MTQPEAFVDCAGLPVKGVPRSGLQQYSKTLFAVAQGIREGSHDFKKARAAAKCSPLLCGCINLCASCKQERDMLVMLQSHSGVQGCAIEGVNV